MLLNKGLKNFLIFLILVSFVPAYAAPGVQRVAKGEMLTFTGWCLSDAAMAKIIADKEMEGERCQLKLDKLRDQLNAKYLLDVSKLDLRIQSLEDELDETILIKDKQIAKLETIALEKPNEYWYFWAAGGFLIGTSAMLGVWMLVGK